MQKQTLRIELRELVRSLIPTIADDYRASDDPEDTAPGMQVTIGCDGKTWAYQTGDNSFTGGAYGYTDWAVSAIYRDSDPDEIARDLVSEFLGSEHEWEFEPDDPLPSEQIVRTALGEYSVGDLRHTASEWHGGQGSALYAFQSTGTVMPGLAWEARHAAEQCDQKPDAGIDESDQLRAIASLDDL